MCKPAQLCLSNFVSEPLNLSCPSGVVISNPVPPAHSHCKSEHLQLRCKLSLSLLLLNTTSDTLHLLHPACTLFTPLASTFTSFILLTLFKLIYFHSLYLHLSSLLPVAYSTYSSQSHMWRWAHGDFWLTSPVHLQSHMYGQHHLHILVCHSQLLIWTSPPLKSELINKWGKRFWVKRHTLIKDVFSA